MQKYPLVASPNASKRFTNFYGEFCKDEILLLKYVKSIVNVPANCCDKVLNKIIDKLENPRLLFFLERHIADGKDCSRILSLLLQNGGIVTVKGLANVIVAN